MKEWTEALTRIGNTLGLEGRFLVEFGFDQIEAKVSVLPRAVAELESMASAEEYPKPDDIRAVIAILKGSP